MRTPKEALIDRVLLLYTIGKVNEYGTMEGSFKLMKVPFLSEFALNAEGRKGFNYTFFRYTYGPFTTEIYDDRDGLLRAGYIARVGERGRIYLTEDGEKLLQSLEDLFGKNELTMRKIDRAAKRCANLSFPELKDMIYGIKIRYGGRPVPIREIPQGVQIIGKLDETDADVVIKLDEDWLDSLDGIFDLTTEDRKLLRIVRKAS